MEQIEITKQENSHWGFAYVQCRSEKKIAQALQASGITCYLPTVPHAYMMHSTKVVTRIPMFPCYLFLCVGREEASRLRSQEKKIVHIDLQLEKLSEQVLIDELRALQQCELMAQDLPVYINPGIVTGDKVLVKEGSLKGLITDVVRRDDKNDSIIINVTMLNQHVEFPVSAELLKKITE